MAVLSTTPTCGTDSVQTCYVIYLRLFIHLAIAQKPYRLITGGCEMCLRYGRKMSLNDLRFQPGITQKWLTKATACFSNDSWSKERGLRPEPPRLKSTNSTHSTAPFRSGCGRLTLIFSIQSVSVIVSPSIEK